MDRYFILQLVRHSTVGIGIPPSNEISGVPGIIETPDAWPEVCWQNCLYPTTVKYFHSSKSRNLLHMIAMNRMQVFLFARLRIGVPELRVCSFFSELLYDEYQYIERLCFQLLQTSYLNSFLWCLIFCDTTGVGCIYLIKL